MRRVIGNRIIQTSTIRQIHRWVGPTLQELKIRQKKMGRQPIKPRNTYLEWNLESELFAFGKRLNEEFDADLLLQAFTDKSYVIQEQSKQKDLDINLELKHNAELAEEGERFMKEYIELYLERVLPRLPIEGIKCVVDHLMSKDVLAHVSSHLGTKDIILCSEYPADNAILTRTLKALVGALIESSSSEQAGYFVRDFVITQLNGQDVNDLWVIEDPWAMLTSILKNSKQPEIEPRLIGEAGKNTLLACYRVGLYLERKLLSTGFGESIDIAKEMAARNALKQLFRTSDSMTPIDFNLKDITKKDQVERYSVSSKC